MKASDYITLTIIDKIFTEKAIGELKPLTKMLYINVLTHHFKNLDANEKNLSAFDMFKDKLHFERFKENYHELHKANLITIMNDLVMFNNVWGSYIDRSKLIETTQASFGSTMKTAIEFKEQLSQNQQMIDVVCMKNRLTRLVAIKLLDMFILEQEATGAKYDNVSECIRHFINWSNSNASKVGQSSSTQTKILGL